MIFRFLLAVTLAITAAASAQTRADKVQATLAENPNAKWWEVMDTGPFISDTFLDGQTGEVAVLKGIAITVEDPESKEVATVVFDTETLRMVAGFKGKVTLSGTPWDGRHGGNSTLPEDESLYFFKTEHGKPGWAIDGDWSDPREATGVPPKKNGPLPDERGKYLGLYRHGDQVTLKYAVDGVEILETVNLNDGILFRHVKTDENLKAPIAYDDAFVRYIKMNWGTRIGTEKYRAINSVAGPSEGASGFNFGFGYSLNWDRNPNDVVVSSSGHWSPSPDFETLTSPGPRIFPETITVRGSVAPVTDDTSYATDTIPLPFDNPWKSEIRFGGMDLFSDGKRAALSTWNGDVWIADGIDGDLSEITWSRFAAGLYQTLGLKIVDDVIYTHGRDQITRLHDLNNDGEADFYECFNNDVLITEGFHEFAFDLQTDAEGNFYFSKAMPVLGGGRGFAHWTPHNGTTLKLTPDGETLSIISTGLRAPGGIGVGPNGEITTGENEGSYVPRCKITWNTPGSFQGVVPSEWEDKQFVRNLPGAPTDYDKPLCWLPYYVDNSSGSQTWVPDGANFSPHHQGEMLHFAYGKSSIYRVLKEEVDGQIQGGVYRLPIDPTAAVMRGRWNEKTGDLYAVGFRGWQTNGGTAFHRIRYIEDQKPVPLGLHAHDNGLVLKFSDKLDPEAAEDPGRYSISKWNYVWGPQYGSGRFSIDNRDPEAEKLALSEQSKGNQNEIDSVPVRAAKLLPDGKSVFLYIEKMTPAMQMEIQADLVAATEKKPFRETIWNTVHNLRPAFADHGLDLNDLPELTNTAPTGDPGLIMSAAYTTTDDAVVYDRLALTIEKGQTVTPFMRQGRQFEVVFSGNLIVENRDDYTFHLDGKGDAFLKINGETLIDGAMPAAATEPITLAPGAHKIVCTFRSDDKGTGRIQLQWSSPAFIAEPVAPKHFSHVPTPSLKSKNRTRDGRNLFAAEQCIKCHVPDGGSHARKDGLKMPELTLGLPDFKDIGARLDPAWIEQWVRRPQGGCASTAPDDAAHIAAYLGTLGKSTEIAQADVAAGKALAESLLLTPWLEPLLAEAKYTPSGLVDFLQNPTAHHPGSTFPDTHLSESEATKIAAYILENQADPAAASEGDPARGEKVVANRCLVCHDAGAKVEYEFPALSLKNMWEADWMQIGCLSTNEGDQPELDLSLEDKQALLAFRNADSNSGLNSLLTYSPAEYAHRTMEALNCAGCHEGQAEVPSIAHAGEKLRTDWLASLLAGEAALDIPIVAAAGHAEEEKAAAEVEPRESPIPNRVRPWLAARMPAFHGRSDLLATSIAAAHGSVIDLPEPEVTDTEIESGKTISAGYACMTCHAIGGQPAVAAFEGQGPNLQLSADRLREDYYQRWMHWPQRFVPTTIMPRYTKDRDNALMDQWHSGIAKDQFADIWAWMQTIE